MTAAARSIVIWVAPTLETREAQTLATLLRRIAIPAVVRKAAIAAVPHDRPMRSVASAMVRVLVQAVAAAVRHAAAHAAEVVGANARRGG